MDNGRRRLTPEIVSYTDDCHSRLTIEIALPGIEKQNITFKLHDDSMVLLAADDELEYATTFSFCCPVDPQSAQVDYENGVLRLVVAFQNPLEGACTVPIA